MKTIDVINRAMLLGKSVVATPSGTETETLSRGGPTANYSCRCRLWWASIKSNAFTCEYCYYFNAATSGAQPAADGSLLTTVFVTLETRSIDDTREVAAHLFPAQRIGWPLLALNCTALHCTARNDVGFA